MNESRFCRQLLLLISGMLIFCSAYAQDNVGIGTTTPMNRLDVKDNGIMDSTTIVMGLISDESNRPALLFSEFANASPGSGMMIEYDGRLTGVHNKLKIRGVDGLSKFSFTSGGLMGIGVDSPLVLLHLLAHNNPEYSSIRMQNASFPTHFWDIRGIVNDDPYYSTMIINSSQGGNVMVIRGNANVGIGTGYPWEKLEVGLSGRVFIGDGQDTVRTGLLIDGNEPGYYVRLHPYDYGEEQDMNLYIPTPVTIGHGIAEPDSSVIFQVQSTDRGILLPRMTLAQREAIDSPEESLMVYQIDSTSGYWYFTNGAWVRINKSTILSDTDDDTRIQVEKSVDEDVIRFELAGTEQWSMEGPRLVPGNPGYGIFIGENAGSADELTSANIFIGYLAGMNNTSGSDNVAVGTNTLRFNTESYGSVAIGRDALFKNGLGATESYHGSGNIAIGTSALQENTTGNSSAAIGGYALTANTTGYNNVALGSGCLQSNTTGYFNVGVGAGTMSNMISGINNTATGHLALLDNEIGNSNSAFGTRAMENSLGSGNTAIGKSALETDISGTFNTALGVNADVVLTNLTHATAIGANALVGQSNTVVLGDPDRTIKVGIGTSTPTDLLTITGADPRFFIGDTTSLARRGLLIDGVEAGDYVRIHAYDYDPGTNLDINIPSDLLVGVWGGTTSYTLELAGTSGTAAKPGGGSWTSTSDRRLKQDIHDYAEGLDAIMQIHPVRYRYTEETGYNTETEYVGVIAQEIQEIAPYMVSTFEKNQQEYLAVDPSALTYMLVNAVKEQQALMQAMQSRIDELSSEILALQNTNSR